MSVTSPSADKKTTMVVARRGVALEGATDLEAVELGHHDVEEDEIRTDAARDIERGAAVLRCEQAIPRPSGAHDETQVHRAVVDDQNGGAGRRGRADGGHESHCPYGRRAHFL